MVAEVLKPNVQDLQTDVIDLLEQISELMNRASTALSSDTSGNKYAEFEQQIRDEAKKVKHLELRMAIVAPMKAGKSTITNAIIGQEILPSRNSAMTTLPTEIILNAELTEPVLHLSAEVLSVFQETLLALRNKIEDLGMETVQEKLAQYPHLAKMPQQIQQWVGLTITAESKGCDHIINTLTSLNDIVRLCSILDPLADPIQYLTDTPRIYTPFWQLDKTKQQPKLGNLVIVDTPGPNEAGENLRLKNVVAEQLSKSSIVLIVLDFTQLKNEAAENVRKDVQKVIELRGKDNLYVLINKVDQRQEKDMTPEQVQQFVAAEFGIGDSGDTGRVFEISARRAFTAASFLLELQHNPNINLADMKTAKALAEQVFGIDWEEDFEEATARDLQTKAERLWKKSGFDPFLNGAITALMAEAAPRCLKSSLKVAHGRLLELSNDVQLRSSAINADEVKIRQEVGELEIDLQSIEQCRHQLQEIDSIKSNLYKRLEKILEDIKKQVQDSLKTYFYEEEYQRADNIKKGGMITQSFFSWASKKFNFVEIKSASSGIIEFTSMQKAEHFGEQAIASAKSSIIEPFLENVRQQAKKEIKQSRQKIQDSLETETKPIIERARQRLNENFHVNLSLPTPNLENESAGNIQVRISQKTKLVDQGYETKVIEKRDFWHWFGLVKKKEYISVKLPDKKEDYYIVSLPEIVDKSNQLIEDSIKNIKGGINKYLDEDFKQHIDRFFAELDSYLNNYRDTLLQAQQDQKKQTEERQKLVSELKSLQTEASQNIEKADSYLQRTSDLIRDKK
ncbi:dynamin family protein [Nostoc sp. UHCC 0870]|uniref:dynamin family protein n=1 Tax=Nostoc sp. UHCC 0870 TaxID=2914041 RepID=UPI001EDD064F|nr:dynamin family protein [Nostoc sp. UHCC 0870]UKO98679.1 dynamin family protein [Nostoc sp. UHCC 0870]